MPNNWEAGRGHAIQIHMTGSQRALELRLDDSRSRKNSPATAVLQIRKASQNIIRSSSASALAPTWSESSRCSGNDYSARQIRVPAYFLQAPPLLSKDCLIQSVYARRSCSRAIHKFYTYYNECKGCNEKYPQNCNSEMHKLQASAKHLKHNHLPSAPNHPPFPNQN